MPTYAQMGYSAAQVAGLIANDEARARMSKFGVVNTTSPLIGGIGPLPPGFGGPPTTPTGGGITQGGLGGLGQAACKLLPAGPARDFCQAGVTTFLPPTSTGPGQQGPSCPTGMVRVGTRCVDPTAILPGGDPFITRAGGTPVSGAFGIPGYSPLLVQQPVRRCPAGFALAKDGVCYVRSLIPRKFRAHPPAKRPPLTGADAAALRRIGSLQTKVKRLASIAGLSMTVKRGPAKRGRTRRK